MHHALARARRPRTAGVDRARWERQAQTSKEVARIARPWAIAEPSRPGARVLFMPILPRSWDERPTSRT